MAQCLQLGTNAKSKTHEVGPSGMVCTGQPTGTRGLSARKPTHRSALATAVPSWPQTYYIFQVLLKTGQAYYSCKSISQMQILSA